MVPIDATDIHFEGMKDTAADGTPMARLRWRGGTGTVRGALLEGAFETRTGRLLVVATIDCPYEEGVEVTLLTMRGEAALETLDAYSLGWPYATDNVRALGPAPDGTLRFGFMEHEIVLAERVRPRAAWLSWVSSWSRAITLFRLVERVAPFHHPMRLRVTARRVHDNDAERANANEDDTSAVGRGRLAKASRSD